MLSDTVAEAFAYLGDPKTIESKIFRLPECHEHLRRLKPNIRPYTSKDDERFTVCYCGLVVHITLSQWLEKDFLGYLQEWEESVNSRLDVSDTNKAKMLLSRETIEGLHITG